MNDEWLSLKNFFPWWWRMNMGLRSSIKVLRRCKPLKVNGDWRRSHESRMNTETRISLVMLQNFHHFLIFEWRILHEIFKEYPPKSQDICMEFFKMIIISSLLKNVKWNKRIATSQNKNRKFCLMFNTSTNGPTDAVRIQAFRSLISLLWNKFRVIKKKLKDLKRIEWIQGFFKTSRTRQTRLHFTWKKSEVFKNNLKYSTRD